MGTKGQHVEGGVEMAERRLVASSERKSLEEEPLVSQNVEVRSSTEAGIFSQQQKAWRKQNFEVQTWNWRKSHLSVRRWESEKYPPGHNNYIT